MKIELVKVRNGDKSYPGNFTKKEREIIERHIIGRSINLFSGRSTIGDVRIDFDQPEATLKMDVFDFLEQDNVETFDTVIIDFPYNDKFAEKYNRLVKSREFKDKQFIGFAMSKKTTELFTLINERLRPKRIIMKSFNYYAFTKYGFDEENGLCFMCYAGGYRKLTFLMIVDRKK